MRIQVATANLAGAAREEEASLHKYKILGEILSGVDIVGLQEVVKVYEPGEHRVIRDDVRHLQSDSRLSDYECYFYPHLDSTQQSHPDKWDSRIFHSYYEKGYQVMEGTAVLVDRQHCICDFWRDNRSGYAIGQVIPWYSDKPTFYLGNRDTQPRSLLLTRVRLAEKSILFCCVHLTTLREENVRQHGTDKRVATQRAIDIRTKQIEWVVQYIRSYHEARRNMGKIAEPVVLVGDFNAEPTARELDGLKELDLELLPLTPPSICYTHRKYRIWVDLIYVAKRAIVGSARIIDLENLEEPSGKRLSDHNPVIAELDL